MLEPVVESHEVSAESEISPVDPQSAPSHGPSTTVRKDSEENLQVVAMYLGGFLWSFTSFDRMGALAMSIVELARGAAGGQSQ